MLDEFFECEAAVKANPEWQAAMRKRGIENFGLDHRVGHPITFWSNPWLAAVD
jgi:Cu2+-containing amine oxidase